MVQKIIISSFLLLFYSCSSMISLDTNISDSLATTIKQNNDTSANINFKSDLKNPHEVNLMQVPVNSTFQALLNEYAEQKFPEKEKGKKIDIDVKLSSLDLDYKLEQSGGQKVMGVLSALAGDGKQSGMAKVTSKIKFTVTLDGGSKKKTIIAKTTASQSVTGKRDELHMVYKKSIDKGLSRSMILLNKFIEEHDK